MKKLILIISILAGLCSLSYGYDFSAVYKGDTIYYNITSATQPYTVEITYKRKDQYKSSMGMRWRYYPSCKGEVSIPSEVTYMGKTYLVTAIGENAFWECSNLTAISISNSVTKIGRNAFFKCIGLTTIKIPDSVTNISYAFNGCTSLTAINIPNSVTDISGAFN
jgi:hypothetical protein